MTSAINANSIDTTFPIAGQDNDSQGFRDNFSAIKTALTTAGSEITTLQGSSATTTANNNFGGNQIFNAEFKYNSMTTYSHGSVSGNVTLNFQNAQYQYATTAGSITLGFSNLPASGKLGVIRLEVTITNSAHSVNFPASVVLPAGYAEPTVAGTYIWEFMTRDAGTTIYLFDYNGAETWGNLNVVGNSLTSINSNGHVILDPNGTGQIKLAAPVVISDTPQTLTGAGAVNLTTLITHVSTTGANALTLAAGTEGQLKYVVMTADLGDGTMTVTNAAWGGAGTIKFDDVGDSAHLLYTNSKWHVIGSYGVTIA